jgi:RNA polymerase sigma factor (sigma-70 family)
MTIQPLHKDDPGAKQVVLLEALYQEQYPVVYRVVSRLVRSREDAEDVTQDVFLKACDALPMLKPESNIAAWLQVVARHTAIDWLRKKRLPSIDFETAQETRGLVDPLAVDPVAHYEACERLAQLRCLAPRDQYYLSLLAQGYLMREIAALVGLRTNTIKARIERARARLQREAKAKENTL